MKVNNTLKVSNIPHNAIHVYLNVDMNLIDSNLVDIIK